MKFFLVSFFSFLAITTASTELKFRPNGLEYTSPNIRVLTDGEYAKLQPADDLHTFVEAVNRSPEFYLGTMWAAMSVRCLRATKEAIGDAIMSLTEEIRQLKKGPGLSSLAVVTPTYIQVKENKTGVEFMVSTDGIAYLSTSSGAGVQLSSDSFQVKQTNGKVKAMDVAPVKDSVKKLSGAFAAEARYWIELLKDKIEN